MSWVVDYHCKSHCEPWKEQKKNEIVLFLSKSSLHCYWSLLNNSPEFCSSLTHFIQSAHSPLLKYRWALVRADSITTAGLTSKFRRNSFLPDLALVFFQTWYQSTLGAAVGPLRQVWGPRGGMLEIRWGVGGLSHAALARKEHVLSGAVWSKRTGTISFKHCKWKGAALTSL